MQGECRSCGRLVTGEGTVQCECGRWVNIRLLLEATERVVSYSDVRTGDVELRANYAILLKSGTRNFTCVSRGCNTALSILPNTVVHTPLIERSELELPESEFLVISGRCPNCFRRYVQRKHISKGIQK